jgi:hypothetical protein
MEFILKQLILSIKKDSYNMIHLKWRKLIYQSFGRKLLKMEDLENKMDAKDLTRGGAATLSRTTLSIVSCCDISLSFLVNKTTGFITRIHTPKVLRLLVPKLPELILLRKWLLPLYFLIQIISCTI